MVLHAQRIAVRHSHKYLSHSIAGKIFERGFSLENNMTWTIHSQQISQLKGKEQTTSSHWPCLLHLQQAHTLNSANAGEVALGWFLKFCMCPSHLVEGNAGAFSSNRPTQLHEKNPACTQFHVKPLISRPARNLSLCKGHFSSCGSLVDSRLAKQGRSISMPHNFPTALCTDWITVIQYRNLFRRRLKNIILWFL